MKRPLCMAAIFAAGLAFDATALAQPVGDQGPATVASEPVPDTAREAPGVPGADAVNPAPGAHGPYIGAGRQGFYDVDQRIAAVSQQIQGLPAAQRRRAAAQLRDIRSEEATQRARHGELRDRLNQQFPSLGASAGDQGPPPGQ